MNASIVHKHCYDNDNFEWDKCSTMLYWILLRASLFCWEYFIYFSLRLLGVVKRGVELRQDVVYGKFGAMWEIECLTNRFKLTTLLFAGFMAKLKLFRYSLKKSFYFKYKQFFSGNRTQRLFRQTTSDCATMLSNTKIKTSLFVSFAIRFISLSRESSVRALCSLLLAEIRDVLW